MEEVAHGVIFLTRVRDNLIYCFCKEKNSVFTFNLSYFKHTNWGLSGVFNPTDNTSTPLTLVVGGEDLVLPCYWGENFIPNIDPPSITSDHTPIDGEIDLQHDDRGYMIAIKVQLSERLPPFYITVVKNTKEQGTLLHRQLISFETYLVGNYIRITNNGIKEKRGQPNRNKTTRGDTKYSDGRLIRIENTPNEFSDR